MNLSFYTELFDEIKICLKFVDHFCALDDIAHYINEQYFACMKPLIGKYYHGMASFRAGFSNFYPEIITEERLKRTLLYLHWGQSTQVGISEEKLILRDHEEAELAHYSVGTADVEYSFPFCELGRE